MEFAIHLGNLIYFSPADISICLCVIVLVFHLTRFHKRYTDSHKCLLVVLFCLCVIYEVLDKIYDAKTASGIYVVPEVFDAAWSWFEASVISFTCAAISIIHEMSAKSALREFMFKSITNNINKDDLLNQAKIHIMSKLERTFSRNAMFWFTTLALTCLSICGLIIYKGI